LNNRPSAKSYQVQTNELTARGGFSGASYIPSTKNYQQQIATYTKRTSDLLA